MQQFNNLTIEQYNNKKIAFPPLAGSAIGVIGDNLSRQAILGSRRDPAFNLNRLAGKVRFSVVRKVLYTFLHHKKGVTLVELLIALCIFALIVIGFSSIDTFSRYYVVSSDRRAKLQNNASYVLEHMSKNVSQGVGNITQPPLEQIANGFRVRVDLNTPPTPAILTDDTWISYTLSGNTLSYSLNNETLSTFIVSGVVFGQMPLNPASGFYINLTDNNTLIEIGLAARYRPNNPISVDNPQITMKNRLYTRGSAAR